MISYFPVILVVRVIGRACSSAAKSKTGFPKTLLTATLTILIAKSTILIVNPAVLTVVSAILIANSVIPFVAPFSGAGVLYLIDSRYLYVDNEILVSPEYDFAIRKSKNGAPVLVFFTTSTYSYEYQGKLHKSASMNHKVIVLLENSPDNYQHGAKLPATKYTNKDLGIMSMKEKKEAGTSRSKLKMI
ncbi:uncharacterized protein F5891DRAFT_981846 [Suillus fuscotomentosus]|uniref:Uncharacterized protein n=1 Tax=Suillus fuscotomentosus TaxID=1912939 RepID=A0AAD4E2C1_9AGAM|nr:uncharacterized protein F5891DRAFT_981846 [Suillus fuscotomentosus]KAG1898449.1 hypothetical protein F5891DRAFT_981846 [Suillus fuscotomentosus]